MKNVKFNGKSVIKTKDMKHSFGCVNLYKGNESICCSYKGCVYQNNNSFLTLIQDFAIKESDQFEIEFKHLKSPIKATILEHDEFTGITVFEMDNALCETLSPLDGKSSPGIKAKDTVYLPIVDFGRQITGFIPLKIVSIDDCYYVSGGFDERQLGLPLLNSAGNIIGVVTRESKLSEEDQVVLDLLINYGDEAFQPTYKHKKLNSLRKYMAIVSPLVPLPEFVF
jgi:hypothetical protein